MFNSWFNKKGKIVNIQSPVNNNFNTSTSTFITSATTYSFGLINPAVTRRERKKKYKKLFNDTKNDG